MVGNLRELIPAFFVGPNGEQLSADEIARRRDVAASLLAQATDTSPTAGGGASVLAKAIQGLSYGINEGRARRASQANAEASQANIAAMLGGSGGAPSASAFPPAPSAGAVAALTGGAPDVASARVAQAHGSGGSVAMPQGERAAYIRNGLIQRGLPEHVADGFLMNFQDESGLDPGINERAPLVPGSRGGFGLYQLTGPRRREYEAFAQQRGVAPDDVDAQLDFLMREGQGSERAAFERILAAPDTGTAAVEIVNRFLRPAQTHRESRAARYMRAPTNAVAANEAIANGGLEGGLTPAALNSWVEQNYAPGAIDRSALAPVAAPASDVLVAESPEDIAAAELAMNDPAFAGPAVAEIAPAVAPAPVVAPQVAQALTALPVNEALPMAGGVDNPRPIVPTAPQNPMQGLNPAVVQALSNPNATPQERAVAEALLKQHVAQNQELQEQARKQAEQANMLAQRRGLAGRMGIDPNYAVDDTIWKVASDKAFRDAPSRAAGSYIERPDGTLEQVPLNPTGDIQNYEYYASKETEAGRVPLSPLEYEQALRRSGATNITNTVGGQEMTPGWKKIDEGFGDTYLSWQAGGWADNKKQVAQLRESLGMIQKAASEGRNISGLIGALPESLQPFINPEGTIAREGVEEVVQRSLREILGAQFTEREGERLIARAYNPRLGPAENAKRVERLLEQVERMGEARQSMVDYFDQNGTLRGYKGNKPSMSSLDSLDREWSKQDGDTGGKIPDGIDPSDWEFMTPEERRLFQ